MLEDIDKDTSVMEYHKKHVYPRSERQKYEEMYEVISEGCMILDV